MRSGNIGKRVATDSPKVQPVHELYSNGQRYLFLFILFLTSVLSFADRLALTVVLEPIKAEFGVSDTFLGLLSGFSFAALYASLGLPVARLADWSNRRTIIRFHLSGAPAEPALMPRLVTYPTKWPPLNKSCISSRQSSGNDRIAAGIRSVRQAASLKDNA